MDMWFMSEGSDYLPDDILDLLEQCSQDILDETGVKLSVSYRDLYGYNINGKRGCLNSYICNFYSNGDTSFYDVWEFGEEDDEYITGRISEVISQISPDGEIHHR